MPASATQAAQIGSSSPRGEHRAVSSNIPARLDRLPWSRFHVLILVGLGITWILDGIEVTIVGAIAPVLRDKATLGFSVGQIGEAASAYVTGAVIGALVFGWLTDRFGRRTVFYATLIVYLAGVLLTATSWNFLSFALFRVITGLGIGGEYAAINSAIDELIPARFRGRIDIIVNGSFWLGAALGSGASLLFLDPQVLAPNVGWRVGFAVGAVLGLGILFMRHFVPESPRWLLTHGYTEQADVTIADIEHRVTATTGKKLPPAHGQLQVHPRKSFGFGMIASAMWSKYRARSVLALSLMIAQAFLFNAVFFTYGLVLATFYDIPEQRTGLHLVVLAASNFLGPVLLGTLFDTIGRRIMISLTYAVSSILLIAAAIAFGSGVFSAWGQTFAWMAIFFFASAGASSAYLTASEIFPLETRALAIATFYAVGTAFGGIAAPALFGYLIGRHAPWALAGGYFLAAGLLLGAAVTEALFGIDAEGQSLEQIADPLSAK
ncbi:MAG TPA: MFS transporter [Bradyrhizobium sp.]|nr:MFS transporter [Bradyrhizobium sp.]